MSMPLAALLGFLICFAEYIILLLIFENFDPVFIDVPIIVLVINLILMIGTEESIFKWAFGLSVLSILWLLFCCFFDVEEFAHVILGIVIIAAVIVIVLFAVDLGQKHFEKMIETEVHSYEDNYKIHSTDAQSGVTFVSTGDIKSSYYLIFYEEPQESGKTTVQIIQVSPKDIDVVLAVEYQEDNSLTVYHTDTITTDKILDETSTESTYSYKLFLNPDFTINNIAPSLN